jgi:hypothetical protein
MKNREYYVLKYEDRMDEIYRELRETNVEDIDYACTMEFDETANAEEVVGYYLINYEWNPLKGWLENTEGKEMTEQDKEVTKMLTELDEQYYR